MKASLAAFSLAAAVTFAVVPQASAATPPEACFSTAADHMNESGDTVYITGYDVGGANNCPAEVDVPSQIGGKTVTGIGGYIEGASSQPFEGVTKLTLPNTLIRLSALGKLNVDTITIPRSVAHLTGCVTYEFEPASTCLDDSSTETRDNTISYLSSSKPFDLIFESGSALEVIPEDSFKRSNLKAVTLPDGLLRVESRAFWGNHLTELSLPQTLRYVSGYSFRDNNLRSLTTPGSLRVIYDGAFSGNWLTELKLNEGLVAINERAFSGNALTSVQLPASLRSIGGSNAILSPTGEVTYRGAPELAGEAFAHQSDNRYAGYTYSYIYLDYDADDPCGVVLDKIDTWTNKTEKQLCQDYFATKFWYAQLYTADPSNPQGFGDLLLKRGKSSFNMGGHLINPVSHTTRYVDSAGKELAPSVTQTGTGLTSYVASDNDTNDPTRYYRLNSYVPPTNLTAPSIAGYVTPTTHTDTQQLGRYVATFTYQLDKKADDGSTVSGDAVPPSGALAATGVNAWFAGASAVILVVAAVVLKRRLS